MTSLATATETNSAKVVRFHCDPGLQQMTIVFDAAHFDWESLYRNLSDYHNSNQRTGPWDFDLKDATPLVPSYWIGLDGRKLGLWYVQRPSLDDIATKRFRGRFAFHVEQTGEHRLEFQPYRPFTVTWTSTKLEPDPDDHLEKLNPPRPPAPPFTNSVPLSIGGWDGLPILAADPRTNSLTSALAMIDSAIARPAWGRPKEDTYGYNGDIGGAAMLRSLATTYHLLAPVLGDERRARLLKKLAIQGDAFMTQALLMRDYWGGSLLQDHGWRAMFDFGTAAMQLWGVIPEADRWVAYIVPRLRRALDAAPPEGYIPGSSYYSPWLYTQNVMWYRDALLARTGEDILEQPALRNIPAYLASVYDEDQRAMFVVENGDKIPMTGAEHILAALAAKFRDPVAARLYRLRLESPVVRPEDNIARFWGSRAYDPTVPEAPASTNRLVWYKDAGFVRYRDHGVVLALRCGPWLGDNAQRKATGPCDQMECRPGMGHFALHLNGEPVLVSPDLGYRLDSRNSSIMLIDDRGQIGDAGYPMSIPSQPHTGAHIESADNDRVRLDLTPAYPADLGVKQYTREFLLSSHRIICRDTVALDKPRRLSWLFQYRQETGPPKITPTGLPVTSKTEPSPVVYSYSSTFKKYEHLRFDATQAVERATMDFEICW